MTHPLTPREKPLGQIAYDGWAQGLPGCEWDNQTETQKRAWSKAADAILTALASGSGDHAELARLAEAATEMVAARDALTAHSSTWKRLDKATVAYSNAINRLEPATVLALLAENAALRAANTEAERKLAEAVGLNDRAAELMRQCTDPERFEGVSTLNVYANMRAWLSDLPPAPGAEA